MSTPAGPVPTPFAGQVALVTGATRGIGYAIAAELVLRGADVCITARKPAELDAAQASLAALAPDRRVITSRGSADDSEHQADTVRRCVEELGGCGLLVNNAAVNPQYGPLMDADLGALRKIFEVNVTATVAWLQQAYRGWMREHGGAVVNIASVGGLRPGGGIGAYNTSKAALIHLTRQLATELGPDIRVNGVAPAVVKTDMAKVLYEGREQEVAAAYPLKRLGEPVDIGRLVAFLLGPESSWITGETVVVDGGVTLGSAPA